MDFLFVIYIQRVKCYTFYSKYHNWLILLVINIQFLTNRKFLRDIPGRAA